METRRKFDKEFKLMTVELSKSRENLVDLVEELNIKVGLIYRWRREFLNKGKGSFAGNVKPKQTPEEAEIARLKKALKDAEMERDIWSQC
jgi:transposase